MISVLMSKLGIIKLFSGSGRSPGEGHGNLLQYSCLGNPLGRGDCQATVIRVGYDSATVPPPPKKNEIYFWLCWALWLLGVSVVWCTRFSLRWHLLRSALGLRLSSCGHGLSCPVACGVFLEQGSHLWPLHSQVDSQPLDHQESLRSEYFFIYSFHIIIECIKIKW